LCGDGRRSCPVAAKEILAHKAIVFVVCALCVFSVLPVVGYNPLPVTAQTYRLEKLLLGEGCWRTAG
jgi:hypothetical protein